MSKYDEVTALWRSYNIEDESGLDKYLDNFRVLFAYNSGKIENADVTYGDTREIFENGKVTGFSGDTRTLFEQQNQKLCYEFLKSKIIAREPLSVELVREVHAALTAGTYDERRYIANGERPGEFKKHDYVTGINEVGSPSASVGDDLAELIGEVNGYSGEDILTAAAYFHLRFEYIHPFADGNGRVGRTLLNYYLTTRGYPPTIIYDEDKAEYYSALQSYDEREEIAPLKAFLEAQTEKTWSRQIAMSKGELSEHRGPDNEEPDSGPTMTM